MESEKPHDDAMLEWWFVQGYWDEQDGGRSHFMTTVFLYNVADSGAERRDSYAMIAGVLKDQTGPQATSCRIERSLQTYAARHLRKPQSSNVDSDLLNALAEELEGDAPPVPIELGLEPVQARSDRLDLTWHDFRTAQTKDGFLLAFEHPATKTLCSFKLRPRKPVLVVDCIAPRGTEGRGMDYRTFPQLELTGEVDGKAVTGKAWLDHQWGGTDWSLTAGTNQRALGWDWFGINMDDGSDWVIVVHRDMQSRETLTSYATVRTADGKKISAESIEAEPLDWWMSPVSRIRHPVRWRIRIPAMDAELTFDPICNEQEVPLFAVVRTIWEGAGHVSGSVNGRAVSGRARGEFNGYGHVFDFNGLLEPLGKITEQGIAFFFPRTMDDRVLEKYLGTPAWKNEPVAHTEMISKPAWDLIDRKGKKWRPAFCMLLTEALGVDSRPYGITSSLTELPHTGALIIDDIEDNATKRRGEETIHAKYGMDVAINAGNALYFLPTLQIATHDALDDKQRLAIYDISMRHYVRAHFGQGLDIYWSRNMSPENLNLWLDDDIGPKILQMYEYKTGSAVIGAAETACIIAHADADKKAACIRFARAFGVSFQIIDDVNNFSDSPEWRKTCGEDLMQGKLTYVIYRALSSLNEADRARLVEILCSPALRSEGQSLLEGIELIRKSNALRICADEASDLFAAAWKDVRDWLPSSGPKIVLRTICAKMMDLVYDV